MLLLATLVGLPLLGLGGLLWLMRRRHMDRWLPAYLATAPRRKLPAPGEEVHLLICVADHWEPKFGQAPPEVASARVRRWTENYPRLFGGFRDSDGRPPRHTFFYPAEEYEPEYLDAVAGLCAAGFGEVEVHLHHDNDTPENLRHTLASFRDTLARRHGLLGRHRATGAVGYAFIHGNWALCNSLPGGQWCGVNGEIEILRQTGCFIDMTLPSAPSAAQTRKINSIYHAVDVPGRPCSHDSGQDAGPHPAPPHSLLLLQGPLLLDWSRRKWGLLPRLENGCLQGSQPPSIERVPLWLQARVQVAGRPDWYFAKLHCHGAIEEAHDVLLGEPMVQFHRDLAARAAREPGFHYHYVTAREVANLVAAAEAGWSGSVADALDYTFLPGPALAPAAAPVDASA